MKSTNPRGLGARPLLEAEIKLLKLFPSLHLKHRKLGVDYNTYKKWAKRYGIHEDFVKKSKRGIKKPIKNPSKGKYPLDDILKGKYPNFPTYSLKKNYLIVNTKKRSVNVVVLMSVVKMVKFL